MNKILDFMFEDFWHFIACMFLFWFALAVLVVIATLVLQTFESDTPVEFGDEDVDDSGSHS